MKKAVFFGLGAVGSVMARCLDELSQRKGSGDIRFVFVGKTVEVTETTGLSFHRYAKLLDTPYSGATYISYPTGVGMVGEVKRELSSYLIDFVTHTHSLIINHPTSSILIRHAESEKRHVG